VTPPRPPGGRLDRRRFLLGSAAATGLLLAGCTASSTQDAGLPGAPDDQGFQGTVLADPLPKPTVVFTDTAGEPYSIPERTAGRMALVLFGYTNCPDVCPVHLNIIATALQEVRLEGGVPEVIFVGTDTARDTPARMREYLDDRDRRFVGLTASPEQIDAALAELRLPPVVIDPEGTGAENYAVGHPSQIMAYSPDDLCHVVYPFGTRQQTWVEDLPRLESFDWSTV
jgi:protein SCO1/2